MKPIIPLIITAAIVLASCRGGENKADPSDTALETKTDTVTAATDTVTAAPKAPEENIKDNSPNKSGQTRGLETTSGPNDILANIDDHLISAAKYIVVPAGGITNCTVTVTNKLPDASFQKVMVEVKVLRDTGEEVSTNYYTLINIEPGMSKLTTVPNSTQGSKLVTHVIKVKSAELTRGEFVLTGIHFVAN